MLLARNLPAVVTKFLLRSYLNHLTRVNWNNVFSDSFSVENGVRQGGIFSPILFCMYLDGLFLRLKHANLGCYIDRVHTGALGDADDI
jgi:hypothetical protein